MKPPICNVCKSPHWVYEGHKDTAALEEVRKLGADVLGYEKRIVVFPDPNPPESVTTVTSTIAENVTRGHEVLAKMCNACNKPYTNRGTVCNACRQRAYRERSK